MVQTWTIWIDYKKKKKNVSDLRISSTEYYSTPTGDCVSMEKRIFIRINTYRRPIEDVLTRCDTRRVAASLL